MPPGTSCRGSPTCTRASSSAPGPARPWPGTTRPGQVIYRFRTAAVPGPKPPGRRLAPASGNRPGRRRLMNLAELIGLRPVPGAGLLVSVTGRCPLHCAHCSTAATMSAPEPDARHLLRFAGSLTARSRPDVLMLTGGEPLLRPGLVLDLTAAARRAGTRVAVLTGGFFARGGSLPPAVRRVIEAVDHFSVSIDAFHEREVSRADVFAVLRHVLGEGTAASLHVTGSGPADPYLAQLTAAV